MRPRDKNKLGHEKAVADELLCELKIEPSDARPGNPDKPEPEGSTGLAKRLLESKW
jgi:hypothetical protein